MAKFIFIYHGGSTPQDPDEQQKVMAAWEGWLGGLGEAIVDMGNPLGPSSTVHSSNVADDGGSNPASGYSLVQAGSIDQAIEMAKGCPILADNGSVEVAEAMEM